jgi:endonuclease/exonuclease/phosphatase family metal-dependent hydrolase
MLPVRRAIARRWPDLIKSGGGGANAILVRDGRIDARARRRLRLWPERRVVHGVLSGGVWFANLHAQVHSEERAQADIALAASTVRRWAGDLPIVLGGDLNVRRARIAGFEHAGGRGVDHVYVRGLHAEAVEVPDRGALSDHAPVIVTLGRNADAGASI